MSGRVTIVDVAARAGVGVGTASDALNGRGRISDATRRRVADVAREMGYRPRKSAQALRRGRTMAIGLRFGGGLLPQVEFILDLLNGAAAEAHARGYGLLISAPELNEAEMADGLIVVDPVSPTDVDVPGLPVVSVGRTPGRDDVPCVDLDYDAAVALLVASVPIPAEGPVWLLSVESSASYNVSFSSRFGAWCRDRGLHVIPLTCNEHPESAAAPLEEALAGGGLPGMVVLPTNLHAAVAQRLMVTRGIRVHEDVVVVGMLADRLIPAGSPTIPSVYANGREHGRRAVGLVAEWLAREVRPQDVVLTPELVSDAGAALSSRVEPTPRPGG